MTKSNIQTLIAKAQPDRLKEIEAAIRDGCADAWTIEQASSARAYLNRLRLSLDRELEREVSRPLKAAPFPGFARPLLKGTSLSEIASFLDNMKAEAAAAISAGSGKEVIVPSLKAYIKVKVIEKTEICSQKLGEVRSEVKVREEVPGLVRSRY